MNLNIKKVLTLVKKQLDKEWRELSFEYSTAKIKWRQAQTSH